MGAHAFPDMLTEVEAASILKVCARTLRKERQGHYGHSSRKPTWLYASKVDLPELDWSRGEQRIPEWMIDRYGYEKARRIGVVAMIGGKDKVRKRNATPGPFRDHLLSIARSAILATHAMSSLRYPLNPPHPGLVSHRYGPWHIERVDPPIPTTQFDWQWCHEDFEPGDPRYGSAPSREECIVQIHELEDEDDA